MEAVKIQTLLECLQHDPDWRVRKKAARMLQNSPTKEVLQALMGVLDEEKDEDVVTSAVMALTQAGETKFLDLLVKPKLLLSQNPDLRWAVAHAFGELGNTSHFVYLNELIYDEVWLVKNEVHIAMEKIILRFSNKSSLANFTEHDIELMIRMLVVDYEKLHAAIVELLVKLRDTSYNFLIDALETSNKFRKVGVIRALGKIKSNTAVPHLIRYIDTDSVEIRQEIIRALGAIGNIPAINKIIDQLGDWNLQINLVAMEALIGMEKSNRLIPILIERLRSVHNERIMKNILHILGKLENASGMDAIVENLSDIHFSVRNAAVMACAKFGLKISPLIKKVLDTLVFDVSELNRMAKESENRFTKMAAIKALGDLRQANSMPVLSELCQNHDHEIARFAKDSLQCILQSNYAREGAATVLGEIKDSSAISCLIQTLEDPVSEVRRAAVEALGKLNSTDSVASILALMETEQRPEVRVEAIKTLGLISDVSITIKAAFLNSLQDPWYLVRIKAVRGLSKFQDDETVGTLIHALGDAAYGVRKNAFYALYSQGALALPQIHKALLEVKHRSIRMNAVILLGMLADVAFIPQLETLLETEKDAKMKEQIEKIIQFRSKKVKEHEFEVLLV